MMRRNSVIFKFDTHEFSVSRYCNVGTAGFSNGLLEGELRETEDFLLDPDWGDWLNWNVKVDRIT